MVAFACRIASRTSVQRLLLLGVAVGLSLCISSGAEATTPRPTAVPLTASSGAAAPSDLVDSVDASGTSSLASDAVAKDRIAQVPPVGWRRTVRGWERLDSDPSWAINQWIRHQQSEESTNRLLRWVRPLGSLHPVALAAGLICVACLLAVASSPREPARVG